MDRTCRIILLCFNDVYLWEWDNLGTFSFICFLWCLHLKQTHRWVPAQRSPPSRDYILEAPSLLTVLAPAFPPVPSDAICPICLQRPWASRGQGLGLIATVPWYGRGPGKLPAQSMKKVVTRWASPRGEQHFFSKHLLWAEYPEANKSKESRGPPSILLWTKVGSSAPSFWPTG